MTERVQAGDVLLAYDVVGKANAPPMLLLHALGGRRSDWAAVTTRMAGCFRVYSLALRGHGDSDWPGTYSFQLMTDDVLPTLDRLGLHRVTLVGHSMGGVVAYRLAMRHPDWVVRPIVEDVPAPCAREQSLPVRPHTAEPLDVDWAVVSAIVGEVNAGDPATWEGLRSITAPALVVAGGRQSHIPQEKLQEVATRIRTAPW